MIYNSAKRHRHSTRLQGYDYSSEGAYYVTVCTHNRLCFFGDVEGGKMVLSEMGKIVDRCWREVPCHFPDVLLDEFIVMPNHLHGILLLTRRDVHRGDVHRRDVHGRDVHRRDVQLNVPTTTTTTTEINVNVPTGIDAPRNTPMGLMSPKRGTLSVILRTFKAAVTTICRSSGFPEFRWQGRFYDHIVRNEGDLNRIRQYIMDNPQNWSDDEQNPAKQR